MTTRQAFGFGLALGLTLSVGFVLGSMFTPHATAQTTATATGWEYETIHHGWDDGRWAATAGRQGWRFVGFESGDPHTLIFERPAH